MPVDYKKYPPNWKKEIVPAVLRRADNCCEVCGLKKGQHAFSFREGNKRVWSSMWQPGAKEVWVVLTVAHLDHDETNHDVKLNRLKAMCQPCHLRYDAAEKKRRRAAKKA